MLQSFPHPYKAIVLGATGTIGAAFVVALQNDPQCTAVYALSRNSDAKNSGANNSEPSFQLENEDSMAQAAAALKEAGPFDVIIDATGALTIDGQGPEKSLGALNEAKLLRNFQINTVGPALLFKHFSPLMPTASRSIYAKLSARVGSIGDNSKGGWYGYRAAKAALNMMLQSAAIEAHRKRPQGVVAALQPGSVASNLTRAFIDPSHCISPETSVSGMLQTLDGLAAKSGVHFVDYLGEPIEW
jgi:NAD(P)-dependent dehydrogenase (short-subunit alcohol dehydrogenase family)